MEHTNPSQQKILVADDEANIRELLNQALAAEGYSITCCANGQEALEKLTNQHYDLFLLDVYMPGLNGLEVLKALPQDKEKPPIVIMSAHGTIKIAVEACQLGASHFIEKPFGIEELSLAVRNTIETHRLQKEVARYQEIEKIRKEVIQSAASDLKTAINNLASVLQELNSNKQLKSSADQQKVWTTIEKISEKLYVVVERLSAQKESLKT